MTEGTITVSSLGETGAEAMTGVIFPPQVALVGIGAPHERPWVVDGEVVPRSLVTLTISADHRVSDGRQGSPRFIANSETLMQATERPMAGTALPPAFLEELTRRRPDIDPARIGMRRPHSRTTL